MSGMSVAAFLEKLRTTPDAISFDEVMAVIEQSYVFTPTAFTNGATANAAGQNSGSCKLLAFAQLNGLSERDTLACFGAYYREDVLKHPEGNDHQNIRNFMKTGWAGVKFEGMPLAAK
jgi:hypothetical protein